MKLYLVNVHKNKVHFRLVKNVSNFITIFFPPDMLTILTCFREASLRIEFEADSWVPSSLVF